MTGRTLQFLVIAALALSGAAHAGTLRALFTFAPGSTGTYPSGNLLLDSAGNLYGTTQRGGGGACNDGCGVVYKLAPNGTQTIIHAFTGGESDGSVPYDAGVVADSAGNLYGTTEMGGLGECSGFGCGTVFKVTPDGTESILHFFSDGSFEPTSGLLIDKYANLYGTAYGGVPGGGVVFKIAPNGTYTLLHTFDGRAGGNSPNGQLVMDKLGNIYGTTMGGGSAACTNGCGTVYEIARDGTFSVLYAFQGGPGDGADPYGGLIRDSAGNLYGTTAYGGACASSYAGCGIAFKLSMGGETVLHVFQGGSGDGSHPLGTLNLDKEGNLIGLASQGGPAGCGNFGCGVIFEIAPDGTETVLGDLGGKLGGYPESGLTRDIHGNLYGVTLQGRKGASYGTLFRFHP